jgi:SAM-dependent methyltransferase
MAGIGFLTKILKRHHAQPVAPAAPLATHPQTEARDIAMRGWFNTDTGEICDGFAIGPDDVVADIGCGDGSYAHFSASQGARIILSDVDQGALERAAAALRQLPKPAVFEARLTDGATLPIADAVASRVICTEVLEHVDDPVRVMAELFRIGRPGALYLLSCPDPNAEAIFRRIAHPSHFERPNHIRTIGHEEFAGLVESAGLIIERRLSRGFYALMWWILFWGCPELSGEMRHPVLDSWTQTWSLLLDQKNGPLIKRVLDDMLPQSQVIIARKP